MKKITGRIQFKYNKIHHKPDSGSSPTKSISMLISD